MKTVTFQGMRVRVDRPKGFVQRGKDESGGDWERVYKYDYGYLPKTQGGDGEGVDVFLGPAAGEDEAHWVLQVKKDGSFDEYKVMLGFASRAAAKKAYLEHVPARYFGSMVTMKVPLMRAMLGLDPSPGGREKAAFFLELSRCLGRLG